MSSFEISYYLLRINSSHSHSGATCCTCCRRAVALLGGVVVIDAARGLLHSCLEVTEAPRQRYAEAANRYTHIGGLREGVGGSSVIYLEIFGKGRHSLYGDIQSFVLEERFAESKAIRQDAARLILEAHTSGVAEEHSRYGEIVR